MPLKTNHDLRAIELELCRRDVLYWFEHWPWTYNPKDADDVTPAYIPFDLFPRQIELVKWLEERVKMREDGLVEKSREIGFSWVMVCYAWWAWRFTDGFKSTFGSRIVDEVDKLGQPDSLFEKMRIMQSTLPRWMWPVGFDSAFHSGHKLFRNPENGNTIRAEGGDDMGRGGRNTMYVIDEAAFIERAEKVEAATSANTDVRIWGSTVNGTDNFFARKRFGGTLKPRQIFRFHYSSDPRKTPAWKEKKQASLEPHIWASEFEIDYAASVEGICIPAKWVEAAKKIKKLMKIEPRVDGVVGGDVGAGKAKSVAVARFGPVVTVPKSWKDPDTIDTAHKMLDYCADTTMTRADGYVCKVKSLRYDSPGVGFGVTAALKRSDRPGLTVTGINTGNPPSEMRWPDGETSEEKFGNLKAEAHWLAREAFKRTYETVLHIESGGKEGQLHPASDLISLPDDTEGPEATTLAAQLSLVKYNRNEKGKIVIESKSSLKTRGVSSPDHADAFILTFAGYSKAETWAAFGKNAM